MKTLRQLKEDWIKRKGETGNDNWVSAWYYKGIVHTGPRSGRMDHSDFYNQVAQHHKLTLDQFDDLVANDKLLAGYYHEATNRFVDNSWKGKEYKVKNAVLIKRKDTLKRELKRPDLEV